jgi:hypothetical protein
MCHGGTENPPCKKASSCPVLLEKVKALRKARLRAEHVAFSFMKRMV